MYTHKIVFKAGDGSQYLNADIGIVDGELIYKFTGTSQPLSDNLIDDFRDFSNLIKDIAIEYKGIKEISVKEI